ncbi:MAG TPA: prolyl oligopeptidase family serine peptidase [Steroidobacteraceae bacterium]|nr:prolyl oligopeptidase family serine peptidase [Steroidobacteraceae bacterium]
MSRAVLLLTAALACALSGCGMDSISAGPDQASGRGTLLYDPPARLASLNAATFTASLDASSSGAQLLQVAGTPACGVDFYYIQYNTVGGKGEPATASGALMVPTGSGAQCSGPRPIVLYAHGTNPSRTLNLANISDPSNTEGALIAAMFAAQGYIVVAPNYVGYDSSNLTYHPYLNAQQQSRDMIDALTAARTALPHTMTRTTTDGGKLFITGYSEGGYVAMATHSAMQAAGMTVTASAPMSGPYALEALGDAVFFGDVIVGATVFTPLVVTSYQEAYGNIYQHLTDVYESNYASTAGDLLPNATPLATLFADNLLPQSALFSSTTPVTGNATLDAELAVPANPVFASGFGTNNLVTNDFRLAYVLDAVAHPDGAVPPPTSPTASVAPAADPQNTLRIAFKTNDLRNWTPASPLLMCGGDADPTVLFSVDTLVMQQYWAALPPGLVTVVDINAPVTGAGDPFAAAKVGYQQTIAGIAASGGAAAAVQATHATEAPFCTAVARGFFAQF